MRDSPKPAPAEGKLGVLTPGMGAVATTFIAGVLAARKGYARPTGSLTQMAHIRLGKRTDDRNPLVKDFVPLADLEDLEFGGWDPYSDDAYAAAMKAGVLEARDVEGIGEELRAIRPMSAVFSPRWVKNLEAVDQVKDEASHMAQAESLMEDIDRFRAEKEVDRLVAVWCGSTEAYEEPSDVHLDLDAFERNTKADVKESVDRLMKKAQIGDWFVLFLLSKNLDSVLFREFVVQLSEKLKTDSA